MNSLKYIFRPTKPIPKKNALKSDELMSNSQRVSTIIHYYYAANICIIQI